VARRSSQEQLLAAQNKIPPGRPAGGAQPCAPRTAAILHTRPQASRTELVALLDKPSLSGIPLLVLGNKNDMPGAATTQQLIDQMGLKVWGGWGWEGARCAAQWSGSKVSASVHCVHARRAWRGGLSLRA